MIGKWFEIRASGPLNTKDDIISALIDAGSPSVLEITTNMKEDCGAGVHPELKAYIPKDSSVAGQKIKALKETLKRLKWKLTLNEYEEEDWTKKWKETIHPTTIIESVTGTKLIIKASWHKIKPQDALTARRTGEQNIIINIDPSMAFGTGSHPSTRMCLRAIAYITLTEDGNGAYGPIKSLLDVGSGTGILSIAAKCLNINRTIGIDIDTTAIKIAKKNAKLNKVRCAFVKAANIDDIKGPFDMVVANIISSELVKLKDWIAKKVKPDGFAVLSGILSDEAKEVEEAYKKLGFRPYMRYAESALGQGGGSWVALVLRKAI